MPTVYVTVPPEHADDLAETLVDERLAACCNRMPCRSTYRWEGEVQTDAEEILLVKTTDGRADEAVARIEALHPYDVPCIERFEPTDVADAFADWLADSVA